MGRIGPNGFMVNLVAPIARGLQQPIVEIYGRIRAITGSMIEVSGVINRVAIGDRLHLYAKNGVDFVMAEIIGFRDNNALVMPYGPVDGLGLGSRAVITSHSAHIYPTMEWIGRVINCFGEPIDGKGELPRGEEKISIKQTPPPAHSRRRVGGKMDLGVRALNSFTSCCYGQRLGIFAGSGVGKSVLLSMIAKYSSAQIVVIGLIGERGREVQDFLQDDLGEEGMKRAVVCVSTSDEPALQRREAALTTIAVAEFFRDQGLSVLLLMDSVTRFAMAQREIGLSVGEPPTTKGYTPSCFAELPKLMERAGPGADNYKGKKQGDITAFFTVLVDGDDHNEPIADAVRGILDGHIVLDRAIANRGRFPAVNILKSLSRTMPGCNSEAENTIINTARRFMATYDDMSELIRLGAYRKGSNPDVDRAIFLNDDFENFLRQYKHDSTDLPSCYDALAKILDKQDTS